MTSSFFAPAAFLKSSNMYEVNIRQYTPEGSFNAFAAHLPRLKDMGVDVLWLMPIHPIGAANRKGTLGSYYAIQNFEAINPEFGTLEDFKRLVENVHALGMKVIIDWVANHTSWDNVWTKTNPEFFVLDEHRNFKSPYDWDDVIQLDHANVEQQKAMVTAMKYWITNFDIDGFRADMAHLIPLPFWVNARLQISPFKKDLIWLAETEEINYHQAFDVSYTWKWMHDTEQFIKKEKSLADCVATLQTYKKDFPTNALRLFFTSNHDENSWNGTEYEKYGSYAKALAVFACTYIGVPLVYSGQELPNTKRLQFFDKDEIAWHPNIELHNFYKTLFALRKRKSTLFSSNHTTVLFFEALIQKNILAYQIKNEENEIIVFLNLNGQSMLEYLTMPNVNGTYQNVFTEATTEIPQKYLLALEAGEYAVFEK
jgi:alpha-amylase